MPKFKVEVTRTTFSMLPFIVEAEDEDAAWAAAVQQAEITKWPRNQNVEYELEDLEELDVEDDTTIKTWDTIES